MLRVSESNSENELNSQYPWRNNVRGWDAVQTIRMINTSPEGELRCIKLYLYKYKIYVYTEYIFIYMKVKMKLLSCS